MTIYFGTDHAGFELKQSLVAYVEQLGHDVVDCGALTLDENDDYPPYVAHAVQCVAEKPETTRAIILGGSGQGEAICANRVPGIRACVYYGGDMEIVRLSRAHNDANVLSLGARFLSEQDARAAVALWLSTAFSGEERHVRRIAQLDA